MPSLIKFYAHCGMASDLGEFEDRDDAIAEFDDICKRRREAGYTVEDITELRQERYPTIVRAAEVTEPEDAVMISDDVGILEIQPVFFKCYGCDSEFETQWAADECCGHAID